MSHRILTADDGLDASRRDSTEAGPTSRAQTEPLAALVAVFAVCLAVSVYAGFLTGLLPELGSDRELAEATGERVWESLREDGVYPADSATIELPDGTLPAGRAVSINVTVPDEQGHVETVAEGRFGGSGTTTGKPGPDAETFSRPIPVKRGPGDVRPGMLTVVVWDE